MDNQDNQSAVAETNQESTPQDSRGDFSDDFNQRQANERDFGSRNNWRSRQEKENEGESYIPDQTAERDYEQEAVAFINSVCEQNDQRTDIRYGYGKLDKISAWFDREGKREKSDELKNVGEYKESEELRKWVKIGLKVAGGLGLVAAATMVGIPVVTPILWTIGMRKTWEGALDAGERLGWGLGRTEMELKVQTELTEKIKKLKKEIQDKKTENGGLTEAEYLVLAKEVIDADTKVAKVQGKNMDTEQSWAVKRSIASSVLTLGTAIFSGIPLGWRDYDHNGIAHRVFWNHNGSQFLYNPGELSQAVASANLHHYPLHFTQAFGDAAHTIGHGLPLLEKGAIFASGWYLYHNYSNAKKKKEEGEGAIDDFHPQYQLFWGRESEAPIIGRRQTETRTSQVPAPPIVTREMTLGDKKALSRKFAMITLARIRSYLELNAPTATESDVIFNQKTRELIKDIVVHGLPGRDRETGRQLLRNYPDNDGEGVLFLLARAGFDISQVKFVEQGQFEEGKVNFDTGNKHGVVIEGIDQTNLYGKTAFLDHHGDETWTDLSATEITYETLVASGLLEKTPELDKYVSFITHIDNLTYPGVERYFPNSHCMILGLYRSIKAEQLYDFFARGDNPTRELSNEEILSIGGQDLTKKSEKARERNLEALRRISDAEVDGLVLDTPHGKALIDIDDHIRSVEAVFSKGYKIFIRWMPKDKRFNISGWPREKSLAQGKRVRNMWLKPHEDRGPLTIKLGEVIHTLTNGQAAPMGKLRQYLEDELSGRTARFDRGRRENAPRGRREEGGFRGRREETPRGRSKESNFRGRREGGFRGRTGQNGRGNRRFDQRRAA